MNDEQIQQTTRRITEWANAVEAKFSRAEVEFRSAQDVINRATTTVAWLREEPQRPVALLTTQVFGARVEFVSREIFDAPRELHLLPRCVQAAFHCASHNVPVAVVQHCQGPPVHGQN